MRGTKPLAALMFGACALAANGQYTGPFAIPEGGGPMPNYWSGTNCRASGWAQIGLPIYGAQLLLNGELVREWYCDPEDVPPMAFSLKVMFDSSHFAYGTVLEVKFRVWCGIYGWFEEASDPDPIVKNFMMMFRDPHPEMPNPIPTVSSLMNGRNYFLFEEESETWEKPYFLNTLFPSTVVYFSGHGSPQSHSAASGPSVVPFRL